MERNEMMTLQTQVTPEEYDRITRTFRMLTENDLGGKGDYELSCLCIRLISRAKVVTDFESIVPPLPPPPKRAPVRSKPVVPPPPLPRTSDELALAVSRKRNGGLRRTGFDFSVDNIPTVGEGVDGILAVLRWNLLAACGRALYMRAHGRDVPDMKVYDAAIWELDHGRLKEFDRYRSFLGEREAARVQEGFSYVKNLVNMFLNGVDNKGGKWTYSSMARYCKFCGYADFIKQEPVDEAVETESVGDYV